MLYLLLISLAMLAMLDRTARRGRLDLLKLETKFKLFALRDELRQAAINGEVARNNWLDYLDTTLTITIQRIDSVSLWSALVFEFRDKKKEAFLKKLQAQMKEAFLLPENRKLAEIHDRYRAQLSTFLRARHPLSSAVEKTVEAGLKKWVESAHGREKEMTQTFASTPETSTLVRYASDTYQSTSDRHHGGPTIAVG